MPGETGGSRAAHSATGKNGIGRDGARTGRVTRPRRRHKPMSRYLDMVDEPAHVKKLTVEQMQQLGEELRQELITVLSKNGGHLGPNLGVVELTLALHY